MIHNNQFQFAGKTLKIKAGEFAGEEIRVEDWWDRLSGRSWGICDGNPACIEYAIRTGLEDGPNDDEVIYGHIGMYGKLIHVSQLEIPENATP